MGFRKNWDIGEVSRQVHTIARECSSPYNDGFTAFELKKDLYQIKFMVEAALSNSPKFEGEENWLTEQEKKRIINILKS